MPRNRKLWGAIFLWDSAWKLAALVVAVRRREWKWVAPLVVTNSLGLLPMFYLWRTSGKSAGTPVVGE